MVKGKLNKDELLELINSLTGKEYTRIIELLGFRWIEIAGIHYYIKDGITYYHSVIRADNEVKPNPHGDIVRGDGFESSWAYLAWPLNTGVKDLDFFFHELKEA